MNANLLPYTAYKPTGVPWLGDVPTHWDVKRVGYLLRERGETNERGDIDNVLSLLRGRGVIPYSEKGNIGNKKSDDITRYKVVRPGDIVVNCMNVIIGSVGLSKYTGCLSPVYYVLVNRHTDDDIRYLNAYFQTESFQRSLVRIGNGILAHRMRIPMELLKCELFPRPPLPEQQAIVRYLNYMDARIRRYTASRRKLLALLREQKQAIIQQAVTRGLNPNAPLKPSGIPWLGDVPAHWEVRRLKTLVQCINKQTSTRDNGEIYIALEHVESWSGNINVNADNSTIVFSSQVKRFKAHDILFGKLRPYLAKVAHPERNGVCVGEFLVLRTTTKLIEDSFLVQLLRCKQFINAVNSSTYGAKMPRAEWSFIGSLGLPLPSSNEQLNIVHFIEDASLDIDRAVTAIQHEVVLLQEFRQRLFADVVTGKLDVRAAAAALPEELEELPPIEDEPVEEDQGEVTEEEELSDAGD